MALISVIVPVYNAEKYLHRCIDSILAQTFTDFEILLVDDGSTDSSGKICDEYAVKDRRIRVFHKKNGGVSSARNFGLEKANGGWITFVDSDDWIENDYLQKLCTIEADMCVCGCYPYFTVIEEAIYKGHSAIKDFLLNHIFFFSNVYSKLFSSDLIRQKHLLFDKSMNYAEDTSFVFSYLMNVSSIATISSDGYHYEDTEKSLSKQMHPVDSGLYIFTEFCKKTLDLEKLYGINMDLNRSYVGVNLIRSMIEWLRVQNDFKCIRNGLKQMCQNEFVVSYLFQNPCVQKGQKRRLFDILVYKGMYTALSLYILAYKGVIY